MLLKEAAKDLVDILDEEGELNEFRTALLEKFRSKAQARLFYSNAGKKGPMQGKWKKWSKEWGSKTEWEALPEKVKKS